MTHDHHCYDALTQSEGLGLQNYMECKSKMQSEPQK